MRAIAELYLRGYIDNALEVRIYYTPYRTNEGAAGCDDKGGVR